MDKFDSERNITLTLPIWMVEKLVHIKPTLSMFKDEPDIQAAIEIIDAIYAGSLEYLRQEEGELRDYFTDLDDEDFIVPKAKNGDDDDPEDPGDSGGAGDKGNSHNK